MRLLERTRRRTSKGVDLALLNDGSFIGELRPFAFDVTGAGAVEVAPGWFYCNGAVLSRTDYKRLFDEIGTTYNTGGESGTDFRLPDFRGRSPLPHADGQAGANRVAGAVAGNATAAGGVGGADAVTLAKANLVRHTHDKGTLAIPSGGSHSHGPGTLRVRAGTGGGSGTNARHGGGGPDQGNIAVTAGSLLAAAHAHASAAFAGSTEDGTVSGLGGGAHANEAPHLPAGGMVIRA